VPGFSTPLPRLGGAHPLTALETLGTRVQVRSYEDDFSGCPVVLAVARREAACGPLAHRKWRVARVIVDDGETRFAVTADTP
jgi:hypothetical protein